jgi:hypothetical protein
MSRYVRNTAILAKIETTYGQDAAPTGADNALLVSNCTINPIAASMVDRPVIRGFMGAAEQLVGPAYVEVSFDVEISGSGTAGTAPAWGPLLRGAGFAEAITALSRAEYNPISSGFESLTLYYHLDGLVHKILGARGDVSMQMGIGERPVFTFKFLGLDGGASAAANPGQTLTAWKAPLPITDGNTGDVTLGCTYSAGALSGGTVYPSKGLEVSLGNQVAHIPLLGGESVDITDRAASGKITLDLTAAQQVTLLTAVKAATLQGLGLVHGTSAGAKVLVFAPAAQLTSPAYEDLNGRSMSSFSLRLTPSVGNDELRIVAL